MAGKAGKVGIVGGGVAGLVAAAELARAGANVVLFEAAAELGGRARTKAADGFSLNQGPHALYIKGAFKRALDELGVEVRGRKTEPDAPQAYHRGKLHQLPTRASQLATTRLFSVRDKLQFAAVQKSVIEGVAPEGSFGAWLDGLKLRPAVWGSMEALARVSCYANAPYESSAKATLDQVRKAYAGVLYIDGGWRSLIESVAAVARRHGAEIRTGARVERVTGSAVVTGDGEQAFDAVLLAVPPADAAALSGVASIVEEVREARPVRMNSLDLALRSLPEGAKEFVLGVDRPLYFSLHSKAAKLAPEGGAVVHVAKYLPSDEKVDADAIEELEAFADVVMPGWRELEVRRQTLRGLSVVGAVVRWDRPRAGVVVKDAPGLFLAGDWVGEEGMLSDAAAASGRAAAQAMLQRIGVRAAA